VGRSLGVHLLLASQRLEEGRLRGLDTHLSYRIGLRTFSAIESRTVLGVPDAVELPRSPGHGYLKYGAEPMTRFKAAYVSGVFRRTDPRTGGSAARPMIPVTVFGTDYVEPAASTIPAVPIPADDDVLGESLLDILVNRMERHGPPAHQIWLPPLDKPLSLDACLPTPTSSTSPAGCRCPWRSSTSRSNSAAICCGSTSPVPRDT
jgi:DNA segregation ATPase FtsK/SpoIIIE, S-DNA-T family